ncbi:hypothetical protein CLAFUW4_02722 [Fulvia fulva]|uniref:Uncharacterized protein n=1 Tax=Passalora fulva TaxID=5499 RepID=A0A9Q8LAT2_PASFU|nr:uncharacterized protein CLAFUR5_02710 [Fulvia fulva]KAK4631604.1 hypothetical protein CLAFUR4_02717 [Fulvia fulva]KAK4633733.1 hypothetical protein CLAFUR0_02719 [Fulvia fulva]UJO13999.1 hypothetical protein CLAFUR5_02710 [Fulvia fulva]WPV10463.1 hypothetical protein CLAFUW4_02722 [Fulvia fulva]WPV25973.1 hypothetical protein CLAFUW7_02721 [Fulvia fulva]
MPSTKPQTISFRSLPPELRAKVYKYYFHNLNLASRFGATIPKAWTSELGARDLSEREFQHYGMQNYTNSTPSMPAHVMQQKLRLARQRVCGAWQRLGL